MLVAVGIYLEQNQLPYSVFYNSATFYKGKKPQSLPNFFYIFSLLEKSVNSNTEIYPLKAPRCP